MSKLFSQEQKHFLYHFICHYFFISQKYGKITKVYVGNIVHDGKAGRGASITFEDSSSAKAAVEAGDIICGDTQFYVRPAEAPLTLGKVSALRRDKKHLTKVLNADNRSQR